MINFYKLAISFILFLPGCYCDHVVFDQIHTITVSQKMKLKASKQGENFKSEYRYTVSDGGKTRYYLYSDKLYSVGDQLEISLKK